MKYLPMCHLKQLGVIAKCKVQRKSIVKPNYVVDSKVFFLPMHRNKLMSTIYLVDRHMEIFIYLIEFTIYIIRVVDFGTWKKPSHVLWDPWDARLCKEHFYRKKAASVGQNGRHATPTDEFS